MSEMAIYRQLAGWRWGWRWQCSRGTGLVGPEFKPSNIPNLATEHTHMTVPLRLEHSDADDVTHVYIGLLLFRHIGWNVNPDGISRNPMIEVFSMEVNGIAFKLNP